MVNPGGSNQPPPVGAGSLSWKRCAGCGGKISDRFLLYTMDSYWHSRCLKCSCCQAQLGEIGTSSAEGGSRAQGCVPQGLYSLYEMLGEAVRDRHSLLLGEMK
ncbi:unnamed protein product [Coregonus sp. 'balchen']|nr:unnamed protein product [Coregonus sp. 'balchen']